MFDQKLMVFCLHRLKKAEDVHTQSPTDDLEHLQRLSVQVGQLDQNLNSLRDQANRIESLSPATLIQLDKVKTRLVTLTRHLEADLTSPTPPTTTSEEAAAFNSVLPSGWERGVTATEGLPYFLNHADESTQWDHPAYAELMHSLLAMNTVKYSAYRLSLKLRKVQQKLCLDLLDLETALFGFEEHGLTAQRHDLAIRAPEMALVLTSLYTVSGEGITRL